LMNLKIRQSCGQLTLRTIAMIQDVNSAFLPDLFVLNFASTATRSGRSAADASPACAATSLVPYTNRPFGYQRRRMNRLAIASAPHATCHIMYILLCACSCNKPPLSTAITHCPVQPLRIGAELAQLEGTDSGTRRCLVPVGWGVGTPRPKKIFNVFAENDAIFSLGRRSVWVH